jgi:uncharacterized protein DUF6912
VRVYLPATLPLLRAWAAAGEAPAGTGFAVTPALREWYREGGEEEMEYVAQLATARAVLDLLAADPDAARRRVIVAVDAPDADVVPAGAAGRAQVTVAVPLPFRLWASVLVDGADAEPVVDAAVEALPAAAAGDDDAAFALDEAASVELGWWAVQELEALLDGE